MKISVCVATFNGADFISIQLKSILKQLGPCDQVIIVDDASSDDTIDIISAINDSRVEIYKNNINLGVAQTFNRALHLAQGDFIFLSDQDDRWYDNKISMVIDQFLKNGVDLVVHDARIISKINIISESLFERSGSSAGILKNITRNTYTGCCMAFRRGVLAKVLPISSRIGLFHDAWIGVLAELYGFKVIFLEIPLIDFTRHDRNASSLVRRNIFIIIKDRLLFISAIAIHVVGLSMKKFRKIL